MELLKLYLLLLPSMQSHFVLLVLSVSRVINSVNVKSLYTTFTLTILFCYLKLNNSPSHDNKTHFFNSQLFL